MAATEVSAGTSSEVALYPTRVPQPLQAAQQLISVRTDHLISLWRMYAFELAVCFIEA
jgi:hypothetical protein